MNTVTISGVLLRRVDNVGDVRRGRPSTPRVRLEIWNQDARDVCNVLKG